MLSVGNSPDGLSGVGALRKRSVGGGVKILLDECVPRHWISVLQLSTNDLRRIQAAAAAIRSAVVSIQRGEFKKLNIP